MSLAGSIAGGFVGTFVLASVLQAATALRLTRIDLPFLIGSAVSGDHGLARAAGYTLQAAIGVGFALVYHALFAALGTSAVWVGAAFGLLHGAVTATLVVPVLLPPVHPRLATTSTAADQAPQLARPGFAMLTYGTATPALTCLAHVLYGTIVALLTSAGA